MAAPPPSPPFVAVDGIANFRDIGGHATADGATIRQGVVYRSADASSVSDAGLATLRALGVATVFDLRSQPEIERGAAGAYGAGIARAWTPVFAAEDYGPEAVGARYAAYAHGGAEGFARAYGDILAAAGAAFAPLLRHVAGAPAGGAALVHCTAGKDRTGCLVALLLAVAGAGDEVVADEYSLTEGGLAGVRAAIVERLMANPALGGSREAAERMSGARRENMLLTMQVVRDRFGGAQRYCREQCGLSAAEVQMVRRNLRIEQARGGL